MDLEVIALAFIPAGAVVLGAVAAMIRAPGPRVCSSIQHFAAGLVVAAVAVELVPTIAHREHLVATIVGLAMGVVLMFSLRMIMTRLEGGGEVDDRGTAGLLVATSVDILIDGVLLGIAFSVGESAGILLTIAIGFEVLFLGTSMSVAMSSRGATARRILVTIAPIGILIVVGAGLGQAVIAGASPSVQVAVTGLGVVALLYLATEELLVEAHEEGGETVPGAMLFYVAFAALLVLRVVMPE